MFTDRLVQPLPLLKEGPEKQGNLLNITQLFGGWIREPLTPSGAISALPCSVCQPESLWQ